MLRVLAIVAARNEAIHIRRCLSNFIEDGIDVVLIDNDSTDNTVEIASEFLERGLVRIERLPWTGSFSMTEVLRAKQRVVASADYDWVIHADPDEWMCSPIEGQTLYEGIAAADAAGFNCVNFREIVFVPLPGEDFYAEDYATRMTTYYLFEPRYPDYMRAWNRPAQFDNVESGGHRLQGEDVKLFPIDFLLCHYIVLSEQHARRKYLDRVYAEEDLSKGWHMRRLMTSPDRLTTKIVPGLKHLPFPGSKSFDLSAPLTEHFWQW